jgi:TIR domain
MKLFISYRREDSHAAHRVRSRLRETFGDDAVFIDRDIEAGEDWQRKMFDVLGNADAILVIVGDDFLRELDRRASQSPSEPDWMALEIKFALKEHNQRKKRIYPVVVGNLDIQASQLPEELRPLAAIQATFARDPFFDAAMAALMKSIAADNNWVNRGDGAAQSGSAAETWTARCAALVLLVAASIGAMGLAGRMLLWSAGTALDAGPEAALWRGVLYTLATLAWGLGPYLAWRAVSEVRARARLPVMNLLGLLTTVNMALALVLGGSFSLLSTRADWVLRLLGLLRAQPLWWQYALQGAVLLAIAFVPIVAALLEPRVRRLDGHSRTRGVAALGVLSAMGAGGMLWFAASLWATVLPQVSTMDPVPLIGYFMLAPALSALFFVWDHAQARLGFDSRDWRSRTLLGLAVGLHLVATLRYFARGPVQLFLGGA